MGVSVRTIQKWRSGEELMPLARVSLIILQFHRLEAEQFLAINRMVNEALIRTFGPAARQRL